MVCDFTFYTIQVFDRMLRIKGNTVLLDYLKNNMLSKVPDHPALVLLPPNPQDSLTASAQATVSRVDHDQTSAFTSNETTHPRPGPKNLKQKTQLESGNEQDSYEVEEICGHCQDNQTRNHILKFALKAA